MVQARRTINIDSKAEYSWRQAHALYLVRLIECNVLLPTTIDAIEPSIKAKIARLREKTQQSTNKFIIFLHDNARLHVAKLVKETLN